MTMSEWGLYFQLLTDKTRTGRVSKSDKEALCALEMKSDAALRKSDAMWKARGWL